MTYGIPKRSGGDSPENISKVESCVEKVMKKGHDKESAIRICKASLFGESMEASEILLESALGLQAQGRMLSNANLTKIKQAITIMQDLVSRAESLQSAEIVINADGTVDIGAAVWTVSYINSLPDSSFAIIEPGGTKDDEGKTKPRSLRHLPYKDASGNVDLPHLRNALARLDQTNISESLKQQARTKLQNAAKKHGVGKAAAVDVDELEAKSDLIEKARASVASASDHIQSAKMHLDKACAKSDLIEK